MVSALGEMLMVLMAAVGFVVVMTMLITRLPNGSDGDRRGGDAERGRKSTDEGRLVEVGHSCESQLLRHLRDVRPAGRRGDGGGGDGGGAMVPAVVAMAAAVRAKVAEAAAESGTTRRERKHGSLRRRASHCRTLLAIRESWHGSTRPGRRKSRCRYPVWRCNQPSTLDSHS